MKTGWLLILILLFLGGILSTIGDRLGSRVGKARLSIFRLRPRQTAVLITVLTGSLISAISLSILLLVSRQLRVGLFELSDLQYKLKNTRELYAAGEKELEKLEGNLIAMRRGDVVLSSGQLLSAAKVNLKSPNQVRRFIDGLLQEANLEAYRRVRPEDKPNRQMLLVPRTDIEKLEQVIKQKGIWVVNFRSAANVLRGEKFVYAYPEARVNKNVVKKGEVLASIVLEKNQRSTSKIRKSLNLLLASAFAEVKRRGSISSGLQFDANVMNKLAQEIIQSVSEPIALEAVTLGNSDILDSVAVELRINRDKRFRRNQ